MIISITSPLLLIESFKQTIPLLSSTPVCLSQLLINIITPKSKPIIIMWLMFVIFRSRL